MLNFDVLGKFDAGVRILLPFAEKIDIRDNPQNIVLIFPVVLPCFFVCCAEKNLRTCTHPQEFVGKIYPFGNQTQRLFQRFGINKRKIRRIETNTIFDKNNRLNARSGSIVFNVQPVFDILDNGNDDAKISLPDEHSVENRGVVVREQFRQFTVVIRQYDNRHL